LSAGKLFAKAVENWPAKVLSIGLAIILFIFYRISMLEERFFSVPLNIEHLNNLMPSGFYPRMIRINLRGESNSIYPVLEDDIEAYVDMEGYNEPGIYVVPVQWRIRGAVQGAEPLQITVDPVQIAFSMDYKISKLVPLAANFRGQVEAGHTMTSYSLSPNQVIVDGPASLMADVSEFHTELIDLGGRTSDFSMTVNILHSNPLIIVRGNGLTDISGIIRQIVPVRNINVPIVVTGIMTGFTGELEISSGSVRMEGENQNAVDSFEPPGDFLKVDCSGIREPGIYVLKVLSGTAENIRFMVEPNEVRIRIR
jgi:hypothetical protein